MASRSTRRRSAIALPGALADFAIGDFEVSPHLRHGPFLALEFDGHGAAESGVLLIEQAQFGLDGDVLFAEEFDFGAKGAKQHFVPFGIERRRMRGIDDLAVEFESDLLERRLDVLDEFLEGLLNRLVIGVPGGLDVQVGHRFAGRGIELAAIEDQALQAGRALQFPFDQRLVERLEVLPLRGVKVCGNEITGGATHGIGFQIGGLSGSGGPPSGS